MNVYKLTVIALLAALAVVGRFVFKDIPNIQPVTTLIIICGFFLGPMASVILAVLTTILSNLFLGIGFWTVAQIIAWGFIGLISGLLGKVNWKRPVVILTAFAIMAGFLFGMVVSIPSYFVSGNYIAYYLAGIPFDTNHAVGNGIFMIVLFPVLSNILIRYKIKWSSNKNTN